MPTRPATKEECDLQEEPEFTFSELLQAIAGQREEADQKEKDKLRAAELLKAGRSMVATPAEYGRAQAEEYRRYAAESAEINRQAAKRQEWDAMLQEQEQGRQEVEALRGLFYQEDQERIRQKVQREAADWDARGREQEGSPYPASSPEHQVYDNDALAAASGGRLTPRVLNWLERMEEEMRTGGARPTAKDLQVYGSFQHVRDQAKALIDEAAKRGE